jgi:uncharacterized membrane protein YwaF
MKKRKGLWFILLPLIITTCLFVVFYSRIECKPSSAGFWLIIALGVSIGVIMTRLPEWLGTKKTDNK